MKLSDTSKLKLIVVIASLTIFTAGSFSTLSGLLISQFQSSFGWPLTYTSFGVSLNMILYGLVAPFSIFLMDRYGIKNITYLALFLLAAGASIALIPNPIVFNFAWGVLVGSGTGMLTMAYGAYIAQRYFRENQGLPVGIMTASAVVGQFALLPLWSHLAESKAWFYPLAGCAIISFLAIIMNIFSPITTNEKENKFKQKKSISEVYFNLIYGLKSPTFWVISLFFMICGATTNGLMWSNFIPAAHDHGMHATVASTILLIIGFSNIIGTLLTGWLTDKINPKHILAAVFLFRAAVLFWLPFILNSNLDVNLITFAILFGILDVATVPPVITLCNKVFSDRGPALFSWTNAFHQIGAGAMAFLASYLRIRLGDYFVVWILAASMCVLAILIVYLSKYDGYQPEHTDNKNTTETSP